jgi:3-dehydroquinate synthase
MIAAREPSGPVMLVGMMGAGKSTVGSFLAERLSWRYVDSDAQVQAATGRTVPEIFETSGEAAFRAAEASALREALSGEPRVVVSVAGGAVLDPGNRALLRRSGTVVWLRARPDTLRVRVGDGHGRPLLAGDAATALTRLDAERRPLYLELADLVVDVDALDPPAVVDQVLAGLAGTADPAEGRR